LRVEVVTDPLSDLLLSVRLQGGVFLTGQFTAPWCISVGITPQDCAPFLGQHSQVIVYHVVSEGVLVVETDDEPAMEVSAGEIVLFPQNAPHVLASNSGLKPVNAGTLIERSADGGLRKINHGGGGARTHIYCGFLASGEASNPLMLTLPKAVKIDIRTAASREWIEASVRFAAGELAEGRLASSGIMSRLAESLLTEAIRQYSTMLGEQDVGWLNGLKDPQIGRVLALIHHRLNAPWSAESLAREAALSRSAFVERFTSLVGTPPIRYLTIWRLQTAKLGLKESSKTVAQLAHSVGYSSEEAFSRAFKREYGISPTQWREHQP
jgi:AraC-like DNA-binding protein